MLPRGVAACALCPGGVLATYKDGRLATWRRPMHAAGWVCLQRTQRGLFPPLAQAVLAEHAAVLVGVDRTAALWIAHADNTTQRGPEGVLEISCVMPDGALCLVRRADDTLLVDCMTGGVLKSLPACARGTWARGQFVHVRAGGELFFDDTPVGALPETVTADRVASVASPQDTLAFVCTTSGEVFAWSAQDGFAPGGVAALAREQYQVVCGGQALTVQRCVDRGGYRVIVPPRCVFTTTRPSVQATRMLLTRGSDGALTLFDPVRLAIEDDFE
jgi:hypothetical protein